MSLEKSEARMVPEEIAELMQLMGWSRTKLAAELGITENTVHQWFSKRRNPGASASILMRMWLKEARKDHPRGREPQPA